MTPEDIVNTLNTRPIAAWAWPRILVGIPMERTISYADQVFMNFLMIAAQGPAFIQLKYSCRVDLQRHMMVKELLASNYTHLLMLDLDHQHPMNIIQKLAKWVMLDPSIRIVSGMNFRRTPPYDPVGGLRDTDGSHMTMYEWGQGLIPVDECGSASLLVHRSVFEEMEPPWFFNLYDEPWKDNFPGEDVAFCRKAKAHGIQTWIDSTTVSPHCTVGLVSEETFRLWEAKHMTEVTEEVRA